MFQTLALNSSDSSFSRSALQDPPHYMEIGLPVKLQLIKNNRPVSSHTLPWEGFRNAVTVWRKSACSLAFK